MIGTVLGELPMVRSPEWMKQHRWIQVRAGEQIVEAVDLVLCRKGDWVLLLPGDAAGLYAMGCPGQWAAAAVLAECGK